jgi:ABC-type transport system involved in multi-copper enzyme maturation permease subunit
MKDIISFEIRYQLKQPVFYVCSFFTMLLTFLAITSDAVVIGGAMGNVHRNSPFVVMQMMILLTVLGLIPITAFVANAAMRDFELKTDALFFSSPISKGTYLFGRFLGAYFVSVLVFVCAELAVLAGTLMPWLDQDRLGGFSLAPYLFSLFVIVMPNVLIAAAIFFSVAALTRSMAATYASVIAFYVGWFVSRRFIGNLEHEYAASLSDPFGIVSFGLTTRFWTPFEKNTQIVSLSGIYLYGRLLWLAIAAAILIFTYYRFSFTTAARAGKSKQRVKSEEAPAVPMKLPELPRPAQHFGARTVWMQYHAATHIEMNNVFKSLAFLIIIVLGACNFLSAASQGGRLYETHLYPVTHAMVRAIQGSFSIYALILITFFAGEVVWRERTLKMNEVVDATPVPTWVIWASKLTALAAMLVTVLATSIVSAVLFQTAKSYHHYELGVYVRTLVMEIGLPFLLLGILAYFVQVIVRNKFAGFFVIVLYYVSEPILEALHFEHHLYDYASTPMPGGIYSDMNGYGHWVRPALWFYLYWYLLAAVLIVIAHLLWVRGTDVSNEARKRIAKMRFGKTARATVALALLGFAATGCFIFYNTNVLNEYVPSNVGEQRSAEYEKLYKKYDRLTQPRITDVQANVDIFPAQRAVEIHGTYTLANKSAVAIPELHLTMDPDRKMSVVIPGAKARVRDAVHGYAVWSLAQPLQPGATMQLPFTVSFHPRGFTNDRGETGVVYNGTFFNNMGFFPHLGYMSRAELQDRNKRKKYGLGPVERMPKVTDRAALMNNEISSEADWINLDTTVSTSADQIALAPGYLQREWVENGRHYFRYKTTSPILSFWSYLSARYEVKRDRWHDVAIEIYYDKAHPYNVDRMIYAIKKSLDYYTKNFSPYQHRQVRIVEFPRYASFAQSFPNTIPYSESIGFIADLRDKADIDYVFYVTAHEVAHQWWAHQVIGARVQGATMLTETMAQYSALMVMEHEYGKAQMRRFLRHELNDYLSGRGTETIGELPLELVEGQQYIHYNKGSLAMYALRDDIGEERVNAALATFIRKVAFRPPPYPTALQLVDEFKAQTPPDRQSLIHDLFETITLYDNKATDATWTKLPNGKYQVHVSVSTTKLRSSGIGKETPVPIDDWIDVGVLGDSGYDTKKPADAGSKDDKVLFLEKRHITTPVTTFDVVVDQPPTKAGVDPMNKLIDRNPDDNTRKVTEKS